MALAPWRAQRPGAARPEPDPVTEQELDSCPFCEGREDRTPPETFAVAPPGRAPDTPGWSVRVVPNKYPAFEHHEVVVHTPRHARSLAELSGPEIHDVARTWAARADAARSDGLRYLQVVVNEGREAGASLAHTHSQLAAFPEEPPLPATERSEPVYEFVKRYSSDVVNVIEEEHELFLFCPEASAAPYEMVVAPRGKEARPDAFANPALLASGLGLVASGVARLMRAAGPTPLNVWLHTAPFGQEGHWHFHIVPRVSTLASLELGAGIYINTLPPEEAAEQLRTAAS